MKSVKIARVSLLFLNVCLSCTVPRPYGLDTDGGPSAGHPDADVSSSPADASVNLDASQTSAPDSSSEAGTADATDGSSDAADGASDAADGSSDARDGSSYAPDGADGIAPEANAALPGCSPDEDPTCPCAGGVSRVEYCADADRDSYCSENCGVWACPGNTNPSWLLRASCIADCDDTDENVHPQATDVCNGVNDDCDDAVDEDFVPGECPYTGPFGSAGACANAGTTTCEGEVLCLPPALTTIGQATPQSSPAPNGSWDWDCDGVVETSLEAGASSGDQCNGSDTCTIVYRDEPSLIDHGCGQVVTRDPCQRDQLGQCVHAPAGGGTETLLCW